MFRFAPFRSALAKILSVTVVEEHIDLFFFFLAEGVTLELLHNTFYLYSETDKLWFAAATVKGSVIFPIAIKMCVSKFDTFWFSWNS